jgi:glutathione S-transferase
VICVCVSSFYIVYVWYPLCWLSIHNPHSEWVEALGWRQQTDSQHVTPTGKEWYYHWKADELVRVNPSALVPTLIPISPTTGQPVEEEAVWESLIVVEYVDAMSGATGTDRLVPVDHPYQMARCRMWADRVNRDCCSSYYGVLVRQDETERREHFQKLVQGLQDFSRELRKTPGPTFLAQGQLSSVDVALIPWAYRYYVFEHYRGPEFVIPRTEALQPYHEWYDYVMQLESVRRTLPDKDRYLEHIQKYADGSARSKVANAVRRGVAAHEFDDKLDNY